MNVIKNTLASPLKPVPPLDGYSAALYDKECKPNGLQKTQ
nr:MAG TPA: hypothetical protein [Caudoviricetes sp.]